MKYFNLDYKPKNKFYGKNLFGDPMLCFETDSNGTLIIYWNEITLARTFLDAIDEIKTFRNSIKVI